MFMRRNRAKNGAPQPEAQASNQASTQRSARKLSPNEPIGDMYGDLRFTPDMSNPAAINNAHYDGGISGSGPYGKSYEDKILFLGNPSTDDVGQRLKNR